MFKFPNIKILREREAFTLMELMVSMSLFLIVVSLSSGAFVQTIRTQRNIGDLTAAHNNLSQILEQMAREIRTGYEFDASTSAQLSFLNYKGERVVYRLNNIDKVIYKSVNGAPEDPITSPKVTIESLGFISNGSSPARITILITVEDIKDTRTHIQTTVSSKNFE